MADGNKRFYLTELIDLLTGDVSPHGELRADEESLCNLDKLKTIGNHALQQLCYNAKFRDDHMGSRMIIGLKSVEILKDLATWIVDADIGVFWKYEDELSATWGMNNASILEDFVGELIRRSTDEYENPFNAIVRCKDCKHWAFRDNAPVALTGGCTGRNSGKNPDWFCADGEK
jgi:hypothetical protein